MSLFFGDILGGGKKDIPPLSTYAKYMLVLHIFQVLKVIFKIPLIFTYQAQ